MFNKTLCYMELENVLEKEVSKKQLEKYFLENEVSARGINDKLQRITDTMDESSPKDRILLMKIFVELDNTLNRYLKIISDQITSLKYLREILGEKRGDMDTLLSDGNLLVVIDKIKTLGYSPNISGEKITIQDPNGLIVVEYAGKDLFDTIRGGILKFLEYKG